MQPTPENPINTVIPVVFAGSSNLRDWPRSRVHDPIQFQSNHGEQSLFQSALLCAFALPNAKQPLVFVAPGQLKTAKMQAERIGRAASCQLIVEPVERGNWNSAIFACLLASLSNSDCEMLFIDTACAPKAASPFSNLYQQIREHMPESEMVVLGEPYSPQRHDSNNLVKRCGRSVVNSLLQVKPHEMSNESMSQPHTLYAIGSIFMATPNHVLECAKSSNLETFHGVNTALKQASDINEALWIDLNIWPMLDTKHVGDELMKLTDQFLLRPTDLLTPKQPSKTNHQIMQESVNCNIDSNGHFVAMVGCSDLNVTTTPDATLIRPNNVKIDLEQLTSELRRVQCVELFNSPVRHQVWGIETLLNQNQRTQVFKIELYPGASIPNHFHAHRTENWQVLSGHGTAMISDEKHHLTTGWTHTNAKNTIHGCTSSKSDPLVLLETRVGDFLHEDDLVHTTSKSNRTYSAGTNASSPP